MTTNVLNSKRTSTDDDEGPIKRLITSEVEYCQEPCSQIEECLTRDIAVESRIETDDAQVTADIYSMTDLSFEADEETEESRPRTVDLEYYGDQCAILRVYRCKGVNVTESDFSESCSRVGCTLSIGQAQRKNGMGEDVRVFYPAAIGPCIPIRILGMKFAGPMCHETCPNLIISECSQTVGRVESAYEPELQNNFLRTPTTIQPMNTTMPMTIQSMNTTMPTTIQPMNTTMPTLQRKKKKPLKTTLTTVQELNEEDDEVSKTWHEESPQMRKASVPNIKLVRKLDDRVETRDISVGPADSLPVDKATSTNEQKRDIFDVGTIISDRCISWLDKPRMKKDHCRVICEDSFLHYSSFQPLVSHCMVQCDIIRSSEILRLNCSSIYDINSCESFVNRWPNHGSRCYRVSSSRWQEPSEFWPRADCWTRNSGSCENTPVSRQLGRINSTYRYSIAGGSLQKYARYRPNRSNACNRYNSNLNKVYNRYSDRYYRYSGGNSSWNANRYCCPPANRMFCYTTTNYCHSFNSWY